MDDLFEMLNAARVRYILIGGQAMRLMGMPRFSMDWDFFVPPRDTSNLERLNELLDDELDTPIEPLGPGGENFLQTYQTRWGVIQFHLGVPGVPRFDKAEARAVTLRTELGTPVRCLCAGDMLSAKEAADRPQDRLDIEFLRELKRRGKA